MKMLVTSSRFLIQKVENFLILYFIIYIIPTGISLTFLVANDPYASLVFGIISMGLVCLYPSLHFRVGYLQTAYAPYSILFCVNCVSFFSLGLGAWSLPYDRYNIDISIEAIVWAELAVALSQLFLNSSYIFFVVLKRNKENRFEASQTVENKFISNRDYNLFGLVLIFLTALYVALRSTVFAETGSIQIGLDSSMTSNPIYAVGYAFITIYPFLVCPASILCSSIKPSFKSWQFFIILTVFIFLLQSTLRRELISFAFSYISSTLFLKKVSGRKIILLAFILVPVILGLLFLGFIFRQLKQTMPAELFSNSSLFFTKVVPIMYETITDPIKLQVLWQSFVKNLLLRFIGLGSLARVIEKDVFTAGQASLYSIGSVIPRFLWTDKPAISGLDRKLIFDLLQAKYDTDRSITYHFQLMADFGILGLLIGSIIFGYLYARFHSFLINSKDEFNSIYYFLILSTVISYSFEGTFTAILVFYRLVCVGALILYFVDKTFLRRRSTRIIS
jgi:hypothetical protein